MKITTINPNFSGIKTVVYYKWSSFIPTESEGLSNRHESELIENHSSSHVFYYSEKDASDLLSFSEYSFKERPEKDKFKSFIFAVLSKKIFPQQSREDFSSDGGHKFFGIISDLTQNILYLDVPEDVWKIELYNEYIFSNYRYGGFIDSDLLNTLFGSSESYKTRILSQPSIVITLGPESTYINNFEREGDDGYYTDYSMYFRESLEFYAEDLNDYVKIDDIEWNQLYKEIKSRKVLKLVISSTGSIEKSVNLSKISWDKDINPNRNKNKIVLRNDEFCASRDGFSTVSKSSRNNLLIDSRSGVLLSTKRLTDFDTLPILSSKLNLSSLVYHPRKVYNSGDVALLNDNVYISLVSGNIGENPIYSSFWKWIKEYNPDEDSENLKNHEYTLTLLRKSLITDYYQLYTHSNNKKFGSISPEGYNSLRKEDDKVIYITPFPGYRLNNIEVYIDGKRIYGESPSYDLDSQRYYYTIPVKDINFKSNLERLIDVKANFSEQTKQLKPHSINLLGEDFYGSFNSEKTKGFVRFEEYSEFTKIEGIDYSGISLKFISNNDPNNPLVPQEIEDLDYGDREYIDLPESESSYPIKLYVTDSWSPYKVLSIKSLDTSGEIFSLEALEDEKKGVYYSIPEKQPYELILDVESKRLDCKILPNPLVETSTVGSYVVFGKSFSFSFTTINSITKFEKIIIKGPNSESITVTSVNKYYSLISGVGLPVKIKLTKISDVYTLSVTDVTIDLTFEIVANTK